MSLFSQILAFSCLLIFLGLIQFVLFGQTTVRKLKKNPALKDSLGFEFISGLRVLNVAAALALPRKLTALLSKSPIGFLYANTELLYAHTSKYDRILAHMTYWTLTGATTIMIALVTINALGVFTSQP